MGMLIVLRNRIIPNRFICAFSLYYIYLTVITFISGTDMADIHLIISVAKMVVFLCVLDFQINYSARIAINGLLFVVGVYIILDFISIVLYPDGLYQSVTVWNEWTSTSAAQWKPPGASTFRFQHQRRNSTGYRGNRLSDT